MEMAFTLFAALALSLKDFQKAFPSGIRSMLKFILLTRIRKIARLRFMEMTTKYKIILNNWDSKNITELASTNTLNHARIVFREKCKELRASGFNYLANVDIVRTKDDEVMETRVFK